MVDDFAEDENWPVEKDPAFMYMPSSWDFNFEVNMGEGLMTMYVREVEADHQQDTAPDYMERQLGDTGEVPVACTLGCYPIEQGRIMGVKMPEFGGAFINSGAWFNQVKQMLSLDIPTLDEDKLYYNVLIKQSRDYETVGDLAATAGLPLTAWEYAGGRTELSEIPLWN